MEELLDSELSLKPCELKLEGELVEEEELEEEEDDEDELEEEELEEDELDEEEDDIRSSAKMDDRAIHKIFDRRAERDYIGGDGDRNFLLRSLFRRQRRRFSPSYAYVDS